MFLRVMTINYFNDYFSITVSMHNANEHVSRAKDQQISSLEEELKILRQRGKQIVVSVHIMTVKLRHDSLNHGNGNG